MALYNCPKCGNKVSEKAFICPKCKTDLTNLYFCPECETRYDRSFESCPECGCPNEEYVKPIVLYKCPDCGFEYDKDLDYCPECGCPNDDKFEVVLNQEVVVNKPENKTQQFDAELVKENKPALNANQPKAKKGTVSGFIWLVILSIIISLLFKSCDDGKTYECAGCGTTMDAPYAVRYGKDFCYFCFKKYFNE